MRLMTAIAPSVSGRATALTACRTSVEPPTVIPGRLGVAHATAARATESGLYEVSGGISGGVTPSGWVRWRQNGESTAPGRTTERLTSEPTARSSARRLSTNASSALFAATYGE